MYAALRIPQFALAALLTSRPDLRAWPLALTKARQGEAPDKNRIRYRNPAARDEGVARGITVARALARCPRLRLLDAQAALETQLQEELLAFGLALTPDLEVTGPGWLTLDVFGCAAVRRNPRAWVEPLAARAFESTLQIGLAATPDLAGLACALHGEAGGGVFLDDPRSLGQLHLEVLKPWAEGVSWEVLREWGIHHLDDFLELGDRELSERLGPAVGRLQRVVRGLERRPLRLHRSPSGYRQEIDLEHPIEALEPLLFVLKRLLDTLVARLRRDQRVVARLGLAIRFERHPEHEADLRVAEPTTDVTVLLGILHSHLEPLKSHSPVLGVVLDPDTTTPGEAQHHLFERKLRDPNRFQETLSRVEALLGAGRVGRPQVMDSHRDDACGTAAFGSGSLPVPDAGLIPLRRLRPPQRVVVIYDAHRSDHRPQAVVGGAHDGEIRGCRGPYHSSGDWWMPGRGWSFREWDVEMKDKRLLRLREMSAGNAWEVVGIY